MIYRNYQCNNQFFNLFGAEAGLQQVGEFTIDEVEGRILFGSKFREPEIVLEYIASETSDDIFVPEQVVEALIAWIAWKDINSLGSSRKVNLGEKRTRRIEYYNQRRLAKQRVNPFRASCANDTIHLNNNLKLKA
jgi:hypothetical protein